MNRLFARLCIGVSCTALALGMAFQAHAEDYECRGTLGEVTIAGKLLVPDDAICTLDGTQVQGSIVVKSRASLHASNVTTVGGIQGESPKTLAVTGSTIGNGIQVTKTEPTGSLGVQSSTITGGIQLEANAGPIVLHGNQITGSIQVNKNTGGVELVNNVVSGGLQCQENQPPPTGSGNTAKQKQAQCLSL